MKKLYIAILIGFIGYIANAQCSYIPVASTISADTLSYTRSGGSFQSWGCTPIDPTYWMNGSGQAVTITFVSPQANPTFRVFGVNDDDSGTVSVNGNAYPLNSLTASFNEKVVCGATTGNGVTFSDGKLTGTSSANFSYQDVQLRTTNVTTILITSRGGAGWGVAGVSVGCPLQPVIATAIDEVNSTTRQVTVYPNPFSSSTTLLFNQPVENAQVDIYNLYGQKMESKNVSGDRAVISRNNLPAGIYYISVGQKGKTIAQSKLSVVD